MRGLGRLDAQGLEPLARGGVTPGAVVVFLRRGQRGAERLDGLVARAYFLVRQAATGVSGRVASVAHKGGVELAQGIIIAVHLAIDEASVEIGMDEVGLDADELAVILKRGLIALEYPIDVSVLIAGIDVTGRQAQGLVVGTQRLL